MIVVSHDVSPLAGNRTTDPFQSPIFYVGEIGTYNGRTSRRPISKIELNLIAGTARPPHRKELGAAIDPFSI
jgi:hypothetical protein